MISTVTTTTVTTVYSAAGISAIATLILLVLLVQKELVSSGDKPWQRALGKVLNIAIVPLLLSFGFIVFMKIMEVIG
ncbi:hypothetical protein KFU94_21425 [Chloroflexi bacterium TSY]|nr:hypothetical protein [Chloroflexi bacterium TSY]